MERDTRLKVESCIVQILRKRESHGLLARQIANRLRAFGFTLDGYMVRPILQDLWVRGVVIKEQDERRWRPHMRYRLASQREIPVMLEIVESPYES